MSATRTVVDGVTLGILNHYFRAAAEAAGYTLERTAYTTFIKESNDFTTGLITPSGEHFAYPVAIGAQSYVGIDFSPVIRQLEPWNEGDIAVANCPYLTKGMSTHLPDYHLMKPVFAGGPPPAIGCQPPIPDSGKVAIPVTVESGVRR